MAKFSDRLRVLLDEAQALSEQAAALDTLIAERTGASPGQHAILGCLMVDAPLTVPQIARSLGNSRQYTQRTINALSASGLVEKQANPKHKTSVRWRLSPMGVHAVQDLERSRQAALGEVVTPLKKKQLHAASDVLAEVRVALAKLTASG